MKKALGEFYNSHDTPLLNKHFGQIGVLLFVAGVVHGMFLGGSAVSTFSVILCGAILISLSTRRKK